jgi:hypothetical protein
MTLSRDCGLSHRPVVRWAGTNGADLRALSRSCQGRPTRWMAMTNGEPGVGAYRADRPSTSSEAWIQERRGARSPPSGRGGRRRTRSLASVGMQAGAGGEGGRFRVALHRQPAERAKSGECWEVAGSACGARCHRAASARAMGRAEGCESPSRTPHPLPRRWRGRGKHIRSTWPAAERAVTQPLVVPSEVLAEGIDIVPAEGSMTRRRSRNSSSIARPRASTSPGGLLTLHLNRVYTAASVGIEHE